MEIRVLNEYYNPVMKRKEIKVEISHISAGTPERYSTRKALAERFKASLENLYIMDMITGTGTQETICRLELYDDQKLAIQLVPAHIKVRNLPAEERKKQKEEKKAEKKEAPAPAEKKPEKKEEKPAEKKEEKPSEKKPPEKPVEKPAQKSGEKPSEKKAPEKKDSKKEETKPASAKK